MGYYIQVPIEEGLEGAVKVQQPAKLADVPSDKALICVINNMMFKARGYVYSQRELEDFTLPGDRRPKEWFLMDKTRAEELSKFNE